MLVAYDSKFGSTAEVAKFIGSAIRYDRWLPDATTFVRENATALSNVPVSFFFTCLTLARPTPAALLKADGYADKLRSLASEVKPMAVGGFAGVVQFSRTPWPARLALRMLSIATGVKEGDYRNWEAIRSWTLGQIQHS